MFNNDSTKLLATSRTALNMIDQVDTYDHTSTLIDPIEFHSTTKDDITISQGHNICLKGRRTRNIATKAWNFLLNDVMALTPGFH